MEANRDQPRVCPLLPIALGVPSPVAENGSCAVTIAGKMRGGFVLNLVGVLLITEFTVLAGPWVVCLVIR